MSICLDSAVFEKVKGYNLLESNNNRYVFKSSGHVSKSKYNKALKRKLKKYKLRKDGKEDQEIIDVSQIFITSLTIKSPKDQVKSISNNNAVSCDKQEILIDRSLIMGRKKKDNGNIKSVDAIEVSSKASFESEIVYAEKQNKKQMDAFKMLMDSRNKVIGINSPGKDNKEEVTNVQELIEKKEIKAKRVLSLQKMAQSRGSFQIQEKEELREMYVKDRMEKRAERLKNMLSTTEQNSCKKIKKPSSKALEEKLLPVTLTNVGVENTLKKKEISTSPKNNNKHNQGVCKEDIEFLKKLSPSLKKKENMLCYFNVVTKDQECCTDDSQYGFNNLDDERVIKVKFTKKSKRKKKIATVDDTAESVPKLITIHSDTQQEDSGEVEEISNDRQKRKRKKEKYETESNMSIESIPSVETRPKRNIKKPVKYDCLSVSSDEELHIFTPKKKKKHVTEIVNEQDCKSKQASTKKHANQQSLKIKSYTTSSNALKPGTQDKKPSKLAPIFNAKAQVEELKAKQKFLHSGIPNRLKKCSSPQAVTTHVYSFQKVVHIQQILLKHESDNSTSNLLSFEKESDIETQNQNLLTGSFKKLLMQDITARNNLQDTDIKIDTLLFTMKQLYPKFPIYRTYHSLKAKSRGEFCNTSYGYLDNSIEIVNGLTDTCNNSPDKFKWTDKYKATSTNQLIGNFDSVKELKKWLISWTETDLSVKNDSDSSDFFHSDNESGDALRMKNNLLILTGKTGSGKTSSVYTVALELSIKVIEVNASSKRTGKIMLQDLQEATQSHKVDRQRDFTENTQKSIEKELNPLKKNKKRCRSAKKKEQDDQKITLTKKIVNGEPFSSQESLRTVMSLILIDDADIVFEQDEGFCSAISQLVHSSKRPVILVTESLQCPHLQKFLKYSKIINMHPFLPRMLGTWLDIMCLAENNTCYPGLGAKILDFFKGDIRKSINCLQYYMTSQKHIFKKECTSQENDFFDKHDDDESSSMSWAVNENTEDRASNFCSDTCSSNIQYFMSKLLSFNCQTPTLLFNTWWSLPHIFCQNVDKSNMEKLKTSNILQLEAVSNTIDIFSLIDLLEPTTTEVHYNIMSKPWLSSESFSLLDTENFVSYDKNDDIKKDISEYLMSSSIEYAQDIFECEHNIDLQFPSVIFQRERDKIIGRNKNLTSFLNPSVVLDRRAVSLDYLSCCRTICRAERTKTDFNSKRNNRFCHYLKSLNMVCKNDYFDELAKSLSVDKKSLT